MLPVQDIWPDLTSKDPKRTSQADKKAMLIGCEKGTLCEKKRNFAFWR